MITFLSGIPSEIEVLFLAIAPIVDRFAIPVAIGVLHMPPLEALLITIVGNLVPVFAVYGFGALWLRWVERRQGFFHRLTHLVVGHCRSGLNGHFSKYGELALVIFVGIPLPLTGAWSGALAAFLFCVPFKRALPIVALGIVIANLILTLAMTGAVAGFRVFLP